MYRAKMMTSAQINTEGAEIAYIDGLNAMKRFSKRAFHVSTSFLGLILTSPLFIIISIILKIEGEGPIFFNQERIGKGGKPFYIHKFRTMKNCAEKEGPQLAQTNDDRLTKVGKFLREHHLDELPQLWNVFVGDMDYVGYRPERRYFINQIMKIRPDYSHLFKDRPGVTSKATVYNGYTDTMEKMIRRLDMDLDYLQHKSFILDMKIILLTLFHCVAKYDNKNEIQK